MCTLVCLISHKNAPASKAIGSEIMRAAAHIMPFTFSTVGFLIRDCATYSRAKAAAVTTIA